MQEKDKEEKRKPLQTGEVLAVCISRERGTQKEPVASAVLVPDWGIRGDAHAGHWHRQVSLLPGEEAERFREALREKGSGVDISYGAFGENIVTRGLALRDLPVGTQLRIGESLLEVSQIGKHCHDRCAIGKIVGDCIMPREGIFAVVLKGGTVQAGDRIEVLPADPARPFTAAVITLSDRAAAGTYEDRSGPLVRQILEENGYRVIEQLVLPDGISPLKGELQRLADERQVNAVFTTGGTGFSVRDLTPEATKEVSDREVPGIGEALRAYSMQITPHAMLSRQTAGIRKRTLIINLPGSPKACREDLEFLLPPLAHGLGILRGTEGD